MRTARGVLAVLLLGIGVVACGGPEASPSASAVAATGAPVTGAPATSPAADTPAPSASVAPTEAPPPTPVPGVSAEPPPLAVVAVAGGLDAPISITGAPNGLLLVNERAGRVVAVHPGTGDSSVVLDLTDRVLGEGERGLLGLALHPGWPDVGRAFVHYTDRRGNTVVSEVPGSEDGSGMPSFDAAAERILLQVAQPYANHNGGQLSFGPDGYLYLGLGDGGSGGDPHGNGQNVNALLGKILRLDVSEPAVATAAPDNPFAGGGGAPEVFLSGLRNPWRFSFDASTGLLWIADVGQSAFEEVNRVDPASDAGANLGWNLMEGAHCYVAGCSADGLTLPLAEYGRDRGCSVSGGYVYRGHAIPELVGWYLFSDYCSGLLFGLASDASQPSDGTALSPRVLLETGLSVSSFGEAADGELYVADIAGGGIYRVVAAP